MAASERTGESTSEADHEPSGGDPATPTSPTGEESGTGRSVRRAVDPLGSARGLLLVAITGGLYGWSLGWDYGAFGIMIGYSRLFTVVVLSLIVLVVSLTHPRSMRIRLRGRLLLLMPVAYLTASFLADPGSIGGFLVIAGASLLLLLTLPFLLVVLSRLLDLDFFRLSRKDQILAALIIVAVTVLGGVAGTHHQNFVTCEEFQRAGNYVPPDCADLSEFDDL